MRILSFISVALLGMVFMVSSNQVQAREAWDWYTSFSAGIVIPQETDVEFNGTTLETNEFDVGYDISGAVGLYMGSNFRLELAIGGREYEANDDWTQTTAGEALADVRDVDAFIPPETSLTAVSFMTNGYWDILGVSNPFEPYIGFGVGVAIWEVEYNNGSTVDGIGAFMLNTMVGANYHINDHLAFGASYRFTWSNPEDDFDIEFEQFNHSILGTVTVVF